MCFSTFHFKLRNFLPTHRLLKHKLNNGFIFQSLLNLSAVKVSLKVYLKKLAIFSISPKDKNLPRNHSKSSSLSELLFNKIGDCHFLRCVFWHWCSNKRFFMNCFSNKKLQILIWIMKTISADWCQIFLLYLLLKVWWNF
jgi:hypothetical protein